MNKKILLIILIGFSYSPRDDIEDCVVTPAPNPFAHITPKSTPDELKCIASSDSETDIDDTSIIYDNLTSNTSQLAAPEYMETPDAVKELSTIIPDNNLKATICKENTIYEIILGLTNYELTRSMSSDTLARLSGLIAKAGREFPSNANQQIYNELVVWTKNNFQHIINFFNSIKRGGAFYYALDRISQSIPLMLPAIFDASNALDSDLFGSRARLMTMFVFSFKLKRELKNQTFQLRINNIIKQALSKEIEYENNNYNTYSIIANRAIEILENELACRALEKALNETEEYSEYMEVVEKAYKTENKELVLIAFQKAIEVAETYEEYLEIMEKAHNLNSMQIARTAFEHAMKTGQTCSHYLEIAEEVHNLKHIEWETKALEQALNKATSCPDCYKVSKEANKIKSLELEYKALKKYIALNSNIKDCYRIAQKAKKDNNPELLKFTLERCLILANNCDDCKQIAQAAHEIEYKNLENAAFDKALILASYYFDCTLMAQQAQELGNTEKALKALYKAKELAKTSQEQYQIRELSEKLNLSFATEAAPAAAQE